jgi:outer membrane efflux protein
MKNILLSLSVFLFMGMAQAQTLEECQQAAEKHYPQICQYGLIEKTTNLTVANIAKGWLPQISASAQATYQSDVAAWPETMQGMMQQLGVPIKGLSKTQYRMGVDVYQLVYDAGALQAQQAVARSKGRVESAQI